MAISRWLQTLLPASCLLCGARADHAQLCTGCRQELPTLQAACPRCAEPMVQPGESLCGKCQSSLPAFECVYSPFHYDPPVSNLILQLKFGHKLYVARALGMLLADYLSHALHHQPNLIIPVPMHPSRMGRRGFNQALELARPVQQALDAPIAATLVHRIKLTPPQVGLNATQRQHNVRGAFALHKPLQGAPAVLVIDDVMTTGATANSLARTLLRQGASRVSIATIARARDSH